MWMKLTNTTKDRQDKNFPISHWAILSDHPMSHRGLITFTWSMEIIYAKIRENTASWNWDKFLIGSFSTKIWILDNGSEFVNPQWPTLEKLEIYIALKPQIPSFYTFIKLFFNFQHSHWRNHLKGLWLVNRITDYVSDSLLFVERYGINYRTS